MSCTTGKPNFRLLDNNVGWSVDPRSSMNVTGYLQGQSGVSLAPLDPNALDPCQILPYVPPARLARGCYECEWYLVTPAPPSSLLLRRDACHPNWGPAWQPPFAPDDAQDLVAVATWRRWIAVSDHGKNRVIVSSRAQLLRVEISVNRPGPLAFTPFGELLVTSENTAEIARFGLGGDARGLWNAQLPSAGTIHSIAVDSQGRVWIVAISKGSWTLWRASQGDRTFTQQTSATDLQKAFTSAGLLTASTDGFTFDQDARHGLDATTSFSWYGRPVSSSEVTPPPPPQRQAQGQLITLELDSGVPRCEWHRIRVDADIPAGTTICMSVATTEDPNAPNQGDPSRETGWTNFPAGPPHPSDWTSSASGSTDFLIDQPPGRYMFFRLRLKGNGTNTPLVRRVRIDFPRITSLERLPDIYRSNPSAEDFTERFLSLFDATIADVDAMIARYPALLDPSGVPDNLLPWLAGIFDIGFDPTWSTTIRREILQAAPQIYAQRGTAKGVSLAVEKIFGVDLSILESASAGPWGSIGCKSTLEEQERHPSGPQFELNRNVRLGTTRLFGKNTSRLRLDHSALDSATIRSFGDPDQDPFSSGAYRLQILVPPLADSSPQQKTRLTNLINAQIPAHTVCSIRVGGTGFILGYWSAVGVDTCFVPPAPPVLGASGNVQLDRMSILRSGLSGPPTGMILGSNSTVGIQSIAG